jgi:hypothetical protein
MTSVIEQIRNRLEILNSQSPLIPIVRLAVTDVVYPSTPEKLIFPERAVKLTLQDIEPKQLTMSDVQEVESSFKPTGGNSANKKTTNIFRPRTRK